MLGSASEWQYSSHGGSVGIAPAAASLVCALELLVGLVDVERAGEGLRPVGPTGRGGEAGA